MLGPHDHLGACCATHQTKLSQHEERCCPNFRKRLGRINCLSLSHTGTQRTKLTLWMAVGTVLSLLEKVHILRSTLRLDSSNYLTSENNQRFVRMIVVIVVVVVVVVNDGHGDISHLPTSGHVRNL